MLTRIRVSVAPAHACMAFGVVLTRINRKIEIQMETEALRAKTASKLLQMMERMRR